MHFVIHPSLSTAMPAPSPPPLIGLAGVWLQDAENPDSPGELNDKLGEAGELNADAVRVAGGEGALKGTQTEVNKGGDVLEAGYYEGGVAWGELVIDGGYEDTVLGFSIQNSFEEPALQKYLEVLSATDPPDEASALEEAYAVLDRHIRVIVRFCEGVRDTYPAAARVSGGLAPPESEWARRALQRLAETGAFYQTNGTPPTLTAVGVHWYKGKSAFDIRYDQGQLLVSLKGPSLKQRHDDFLRYAFGVSSPLVEAMPLYVQECNVKQTEFWEGAAGEYPESQTEQFDEAMRAMQVLMDEQGLDPRVRYVGPFAPWEAPNDYVISIDYARTPDVHEPLTPSGAAVKYYVPPTA